MIAMNVLLLEDDPQDAVLVRRALEARFPALAVEHVQTRPHYLDRLADARFDVVVSDGSVPGCEGMKALHLARERQPLVPFVYLSGSVGATRDERGLEALGVTAVLDKTELPRLGEVVGHAMANRASLGNADPRLMQSYEHLVGAVRELSLARDLAAVTAVVRRAARAITGADGATFVLRDGDLCHYADEDAIGPLWKGQRFPMHACISGWAMLNRQPAVVEDIFADPRIPVSAYEPTFVRSVVMVPIRALEPIGAIGTYWAKRRLPEVHEVRLLQALADTTAVALENVRVYAELETRVAERTAELEAFAYAVSHDLRAPIRHVNAYASILLEEHGAALDEDCVDGLRDITVAATRMNAMVDGLLELSRTAKAPLLRQPVDLAKLARELALECRRDAAHEVEFTVPTSLPAEGDPTLLRVVLANLLGNAWKFTAATPRAEVALGVEHQAGQAPIYYVRDNGAGFDPRAADRLFGVFQRLHAQEAFPGTGIGLATVQRIVRRHGGKIWATGAPQQGATFYFTLGPER